MSALIKKILTSKQFLILLCLASLYSLTGFFLAPYLLRHYGPRVIFEQTQKRAVIGQVRINPFLLTFEVNDFQIRETDGQQIIGFARFYCDFELESIVKRAWTFSQFALTAPQVNVVVAEDGSINLAQLAPPPETPEATTEGKKALPPLIVGEISIDQGQIGLVDRRHSKPAAIHYQALQLAIKNFTTLPGQEGQVAFSAKGDEGESLRGDGRFGLSPFLARGSVVVEGLHLSTLFPFVRDLVALAPPQGKVAVKGNYSLEGGGEGGRATLSELDIVADGVATRLEEAEAPFLELAALKITGGHLDLAQRRVEVKSVALSGARARLAVDENGHLNVSRIVKSAADPKPHAKSAPGGDGGGPWKFVLGGLDLGDLAAEYRDLSRVPERRVSIGSLGARCKAEAELSAGTIKGAVSDIELQAAGVKAGLADQEQPLLTLDQIALEGGGLDLEAKDFVADKVAVQGGKIDVVRQADGTISLAQLAPAPPKAEEAKKNEEQASNAASSARVMFKIVAVSGIEAAVSDLTLRPTPFALKLRDLTLTLADVDGKSPMNFDLALKVDEGGRIKTAGTINPAGPSLEAKVEVMDLNLVPAQPYVSQVAAVSLKSGALTGTGGLRLGCNAKVHSKPSGCPSFKGGFAVNNFLVTGESGKEALVGWKSLRTDQLNLDGQASALEVGDLKITEPTAKVVITKDRSLNLAQLIKSRPAAKSPSISTSGGGEPFAYRVRRLLVNNGKVDFADFSLITPFGTKIHELKGVVSGITSKKGSRAQVKLDGRVDDYGTANVKGELDTSAPKDFTDVSLTFRNVEMARLTPYSGKFAGRQIKSGKLSVDLEYKINRSELSGDNQFRVERLTLGDRVESPDAVNLPLDLAIALLEDSNGVIDLGLPVRGNLNAPEFSFGAVVGKALASLLVKIVTSPFRILGALLPGLGEEASLNAVVFAAGQSEVPPPEKEKLAKLAEALQKRPQLKLTVTGVYNPVSDKAVLQARQVSRALAKVLGQKSEAADDLDAVDFGSSETEDALVDLFKERFGAEAYKAVKAEIKAERQAEKEAAKALDASGKQGASAGAGEEDPGRLAKLLFARLTEGEKVADSDLALLADNRAQAVINVLRETGTIPAERLAAMPAKALDPKAGIAAELNLEATSP